jgi:hypothetical protein
LWITRFLTYLVGVWKNWSQFPMILPECRWKWLEICQENTWHHQWMCSEAALKCMKCFSGGPLPCPLPVSGSSMLIFKPAMAARVAAAFRAFSDLIWRGRLEPQQFIPKPIIHLETKPCEISSAVRNQLEFEETRIGPIRHEVLLKST